MNKLGKLSITAKCHPETAALIFNGIDSISEYTEEFSDDTHTRFTLNFDPECDPSEELFFAFAKQNTAIVDMSHDRLTLEDIFLRLTENDISATDESLENEIGENPEKSFVEEDYTPLFSSNNDTNEVEEKEESEE